MSEPFKEYKRKLRWRGSMRKESAHGLTPCPHCGGDLQYRQPTGGSKGYFQCQGCGNTWDDSEQTAAAMLPHIACPKCGRNMYFRSGASLGGMWPNGAWECDSGDYSHMLSPEQLVPDTYQEPPHADTGHSDLTLPEHWGRSMRRMAAQPIGPGDNPTTCPYCGSDDTAAAGQQAVPGYSRSPFRFTQYRCQQCGQHFVPGAITGIEHEEAEPQTFDHPDPWMDNEPGTTKFPEDWQ